MTKRAGTICRFGVGSTPLNQPNQHLGRLARQSGDFHRYRGQARLDILAQGAVVEADDGEVVGDAVALLFRRAHRGDSEHIVQRDDSVWGRRLAEQFGGRAGGAAGVEVGEHHAAGLIADAVRLQRGFVALQAVARHGQPRGSAQIRHPPTPRAQQVVGRHVRRADVVVVHRADGVFRLVPPNQHEGEPLAAEPLDAPVVRLRLHQD